jgi:hypothetical protein
MRPDRNDTPSDRTADCFSDGTLLNIAPVVM